MSKDISSNNNQKYRYHLQDKQYKAPSLILPPRVLPQKNQVCISKQKSHCKKIIRRTFKISQTSIYSDIWVNPVRPWFLISKFHTSHKVKTKKCDKTSFNSQHRVRSEIQKVDKVSCCSLSTYSIDIVHEVKCQIGRALVKIYSFLHVNYQIIFFQD